MAKIYQPEKLLSALCEYMYVYPGRPQWLLGFFDDLYYFFQMTDTVVKNIDKLTTKKAILLFTEFSKQVRIKRFNKRMRRIFNQHINSLASPIEELSGSVYWYTEFTDFLDIWEDKLSSLYILKDYEIDSIENGEIISETDDFTEDEIHSLRPLTKTEGKCDPADDEEDDESDNTPWGKTPLVPPVYPNGTVAIPAESQTVLTTF